MTDQGAVVAEARAVTQDDAKFVVSDNYRYYVVWLLFTVYVFNFVDRQILSILVQPIKQELGFSDTQIGLLGGLAFALLYSTLGIPIARRADRSSRVNIISVSLLIWSSFTALSGLARGFWQFLFARVFVGVGEAGCSPAAYSLIADYFEPKRRSTAISIYSMGIAGGNCLGLLVGARVAHAYGWRAAFFVVGLPGVLLALVLKLTLREPPRGFSDAVRVTEAAPPVRQVLGTLWAKPAFRNLSLAAALQSFVGYGIGSFYPAFLMRSHAMSLAEASRWLALIMVAGGAIGTYGGGWLADRLASKRRDARYQVWVPGISLLINFPLALFAFTLPVKAVVLWLMIPMVGIGAMYLGPTFATTQSLVGLRERALAGALLLFIINLIGLGLGPLLTGVLSDAFKAHLVAQGVGPTEAVAQGLRYALCSMVSVSLLAAFHYQRAARTLRRDLELGNAAAPTTA
jgi:MFS family permease